jgi:putative membrane protein
MGQFLAYLLTLWLIPPIRLYMSGLDMAGPALFQNQIWAAWKFDPFLITLLGTLSWLYLRGVYRLWQRAGVGRGIRTVQAACFGAGVFTLVIALLSPLDFSAHLLFSAHMAQHMLLIFVAAPLLVIASPHLAVLWALPPAWRRRVGAWWNGASLLRQGAHGLTHPAVVWGLHVGAIWLWHVPLFYEAALSNEFLHAVEHATFFGTAVLFWWVLKHCGVRRRLGYGAAMLFVFAGMIQCTMLGALITFASAPWYAMPLASPAALWLPLTPLADQQLAGLIMWIPGGPVYLWVFLRLMAGWLRASEQEAQRLDNLSAVACGPLRLRVKS